MKCWNSAFNAQGSRLIIVVVQLGAMKIFDAAVEELGKKERQDETQFTTKIDGFLSFIPCWMLMYFFAGFFWISPCVWPNSGFWCCVLKHPQEKNMFLLVERENPSYFDLYCMSCTSLSLKQCALVQHCNNWRTLHFAT